MLMKHGYPPINIKFADRRRYYDAFTAYHRNGDNGKAMVGLVAEYLLARMKTMLALIG